MDFLSGDLDRIFSVLFEMGAVEPLLNKDWKEMLEANQFRWPEIGRTIKGLNACKSMNEIREFIKTLSPEMVNAVVIEVAREMANFQERPQSPWH